ncbi:MAG: hypothetical protein FWD93_00685 [Coriobacteriia bacterium]|nr:hypothetical protein [Coriobacteriia bacterium]
MKAHYWKRLPEIVTTGIYHALSMEGYSPAQIDAYLTLAGQPHFTKTHGRKPVAGLNRAIDLLHFIDLYLDSRQLFQPSISRDLNRDLCHATGFPSRDYQHPREFFIEDMARFGIELDRG